MICLAVDAMSGDGGITATLPSSLRFLHAVPNASIILVGDSSLLQQELNQRLNALYTPVQERVLLHHASEVVTMNDAVTLALRGKKDSSMRKAISLVKEGKAQGCLSSGNTGALMALAYLMLKTLPGIDRPAIASNLPTLKGQTTVLDLGANIECTAEHLYQFAILGSAVAACHRGISRPSIGLLNVGEELTKGNETVKRAAEMLRNSTLNFYGNVEGHDVYKGTVDVVVCDGFVGNVLLKTSEGLASMMGKRLKETFLENFYSKCVGLLAKPVLNRFRSVMDHRRYNGASLVGLQGLVMKSHGSADDFAFEHALHRLYSEVEQGLLEKIQRSLSASSATIESSASSALPNQGDTNV
ncbi:MAG: phosphate acyltransferase PlsX [Pseudomonadota bacterium]